MGDIAEMMLDGTLCEVCGVFLTPGEDYPRVCQFCWDTMTPKERTNRVLFIEKEPTPMTIPTCTTNELMRCQFTRLNEARALAHAELKPISLDTSAQEKWVIQTENDAVYAKIDGIDTAMEIVIQTWKEYLGC